VAGTSLSAETVLARTPGVLEVTVGGSIVLHDPNTDRYARLNSTAVQIWEQLGQSASLAELTSGLSARYGLDTKRAERDVEGLAAALLARGMALIVEAPAD
jgi:hypothetical protein